MLALLASKEFRRGVGAFLGTAAPFMCAYWPESSPRWLCEVIARSLGIAVGGGG